MSEPHYGELADRIYPGPQPVGISLRDWFAGQALAGLLAAQIPDNGKIKSPEAAYAEGAYRLADAMLAAREPTQ